MADQNGKQPENFDELYNGDRSFILGGTTFHWDPLHWREWGDVVDARVAEEVEKEKKLRAEIARLKGDGVPEDVAEDQAAETLDDATLVETFQKIVDRCLVYVTDSEKESFLALVNNPEKRVTIAQLNALTVWLQEVQTPDRPTNTPAVSSPGPGTTGATSQAA